MSTDACARASSAEARVRHGINRIALLGHRRGSASLPALAYLGDLRLREQEDVEADLRHGSRRDLEGGAELGDPDAIRVPGKRGLDEVELAGEEAGDLQAVLAHRGQRARRATELCREPVAPKLGEPRSGVEHGDEPTGRLEPEGRRHGLLEQRATGHRRVAMRAGEPRAGRCDAVDLVEHEA